MSAQTFDEVARNSIWREHVRKEDKITRPPVNFMVNPKNLHPLPLKPSQLDPRLIDQMDINNDGKITEEEKRIYAKLSDTLKKSGVAALSTSHSFTESQEIGRLLERQRRKRTTHPGGRFGIIGSDVTNYAEDYARMAKCSPYAKGK
mmetsp:Transcript_11130/g.14723  ORF Transcript_11130/g.14723 Transcript_11130/m.14723 type:complete len:147 (-) Transcript_11130:773-1213(-)